VAFLTADAVCNPATSSSSSAALGRALWMIRVTCLILLCRCGGTNQQQHKDLVLQQL